VDSDFFRYGPDDVFHLGFYRVGDVVPELDEEVVGMFAGVEQILPEPRGVELPVYQS
jgi:hypothetical protein